MEPVTPITGRARRRRRLVLAGLRMILGGAPDLEIVGEAGRRAGRDRAGRAREAGRGPDGHPDAADGRPAGDAGAALVGSTRVIVLTTFDTDEMVLTALQNGASGFLLKDTPPVELIAAVRRVAAGDPMLSPSVTSQLIAAVTKPQDDERRRDGARGAGPADRPGA